MVLAGLERTHHQKVRSSNGMVLSCAPDLAFVCLPKMLVDSFVDNVHFLRRRGVEVQQVAPGMLTDGNNRIGPAHEQRHCDAQEGAICESVMLGEPLENEIVHCHDSGAIHPRQQVFGGMEDTAGGKPAFDDRRAQELTGKRAEPPGVLTQPNRAGRNRRDGSGQLVAAVAVVKEVQVDVAAAVLPQCGGKALGIASQAGRAGGQQVQRQGRQAAATGRGRR